MADHLPVVDEMDHNGNSDFLTLHSFLPSFFFVFVPTVLLEERARTFQDALDKLYEDQYVEYFEALEANYHTTIRIPAADAALALATSANPASRCSRCGRAPPKWPQHRLRMLAKPKFEE